MNIYRNASNKIALSTFPSIEGGYILLRFTRGTSNVYAISPNIVSEEFPMVAQITEIGSGTPVPADGEVLLDAGKWTCYAYEQVSATNYNPDCPERFLEEIPINVFGDAATVLNQTPAACPSGSGAVDSVNTQTGAVVLDGGDIDVTDFMTVTSSASAFVAYWIGASTVVFRDTGVLQSGKPIYVGIGSVDDPDTDGIKWDGSVWTINVGGNAAWTSAEDVANPTLVVTWATALGATYLPLPTTSDLYTGTIQEVLEALATRQGPREAVWEGYITQVGTAAPKVVELTNTLGGVPVLTYDAPGNYDATLVGAFGQFKTSWWFGPANSAEPESGGFYLKMTCSGDDVLEINSVKDADIGADDTLQNAYFKITVKR